MNIPTDLEDRIDEYRKSVPWYARLFLAIRIAPLAIPLFIILLAAVLGISVGAAIAMLCTDGTMPSWLLWLC